MNLDETIKEAKVTAVLYEIEARKCIQLGGSFYEERAKRFRESAKEFEQVVEWLEELKTYRAADRPRGEWITYYPPMSDMQKKMCGVKEKGYVPDKRFGRSKCSLCGCGRPMYEDNYCPNCGARMKGAGGE